MNSVCVLFLQKPAKQPAENILGRVQARREQTPQTVEPGGGGGGGRGGGEDAADLESKAEKTQQHPARGVFFGPLVSLGKISNEDCEY